MSLNVNAVKVQSIVHCLLNTTNCMDVGTSSDCFTDIWQENNLHNQLHILYMVSRRNVVNTDKLIDSLWPQLYFSDFLVFSKKLGFSKILCWSKILGCSKILGFSKKEIFFLVLWTALVLILECRTLDEEVDLMEFCGESCSFTELKSDPRPESILDLKSISLTGMLIPV